jgi:vanillate O-demethylase monooxygenase subunit
MPVFEWFDNPQWAYGGGLYHIACDYRLTIDNLMDLTQETRRFHSSSIGQQEIDETPSRTITEGDRVITSRFMEGIKAPPFWQMAMRANDLARSSHRRPLANLRASHAPSHVLIEVGVALAGKAGYNADPERQGLQCCGLISSRREKQTRPFIIFGAPGASSNREDRKL